MAASKAISAAQFSRWMEPLVPPSPVAVAVSGGADSMALALLAHSWCGKVVALTVDHGLRNESAAEAKQVRAWLKARGITHHTLVWKHGKLRGNTQAQARTARYRLMAQWCKKHRIEHLLVAHHMDDQAETVLLRLKRGSHIAGLSAMQPASEQYGIALLRPLLSCSKASLIATLQKMRQEWIEDPSNASLSYDRNRLRALLATLPNRDDLVEQLAATAKRLSHLRAADAAGLSEFLRRHSRAEAGHLACDMQALSEAGKDLALQALSALLKKAGGQDYPPRFASVERLYADISGKSVARRTLAGCLVERSGAKLLIRRETGLKRRPS